MTKKALITGITGQDGAYLAEFLLKKDYEVHGIKRRASSINTARIDHLYTDPHVENGRLKLHYGDMTDSSSLQRTIQAAQPDEIYNLAAQSHVAVSFEEPEYTAESDAVGTLRVLEAIRNLGLENTNIKVTDRGFIEVDPQRRTGDPHIFAIGDIAGDPMLAHKGTHEGFVAVEAIAGKKTVFNPLAIPAVVFTDPRASSQTGSRSRWRSLYKSWEVATAATMRPPGSRAVYHQPYSTASSSVSREEEEAGGSKKAVTLTKWSSSRRWAPMRRA